MKLKETGAYGPRLLEDLELPALHGNGQLRVTRQTPLTLVVARHGVPEQGSLR